MNIWLWSCNGTLAQRWSVSGGQPIRPMGNLSLSLYDRGLDNQTMLVGGPAQNWS